MHDHIDKFKIAFDEKPTNLDKGKTWFICTFGVEQVTFNQKLENIFLDNKNVVNCFNGLIRS